MKDFLKRRLLDPIVALLVQGVTPDKVALAVAFGAIGGVFPVLGASTPICALAAILWRLNLPVVQLVNFFVYPLQILLIIPFVRVGEAILGSEPQPLSIREGFTIISEGVVHAVTVLWDAIIHATLGWIVIGPIAVIVLHRLLTPLMQAVAERVRMRPQVEPGKAA